MVQRPYLLGVGRRAGARRSSLTKPALFPGQLGLRNWPLLPSCPTKGLPSTPAEAPHVGTPSLPVPARSKPGLAVPQVRPSRGHQGSNCKRVSWGGDNRAGGIWAVTDGPGPLSGEALAGSVQATSEAAHVGEAVAARGRGSPEPPSLAQPRPSQPTRGDLAPLLWPSGLCGLSPGHRAAAPRPRPLPGLRPPEP